MSDDDVIDVEPTPAHQPQSLAVRSNVLLMPVMDVDTALARLTQFQEFCNRYLQESKDGGTDGGDYGVIPGTKKKTLLKSGAEKLCELYGLADEYVIVAKVEDWQQGLFDYTIECRLRTRRDDNLVGTGLGSCSSFESRYRWRDVNRSCPSCGADAVIRGKEEYGGGWVCWKRKDGCGATFAETDPAITNQKLGRVENPDIIDVKNTVLKIAKKRAKVDAVIGVTRSSGIFTQDLDDLVGPAGGTNAAAATTVEPVVAQPVVAEPVSAAPVAQTASPVDSPAEPASSAPQPSAAVPSPVQSDSGPVEGVLVTSLNTRNGITNGKPWLLYIVGFGGKVKASDNQLVDTATTLDEKLATAAENARSSKIPVLPEIVPGKKKGSYSLKALPLPANR